MRIKSIKIRNWRNFTDVDVSLESRTFIVGANASGKSNFLDVFRFLRDVASASGGGLQKALKDRGGLGKLRSLAARQYSNILLDVVLTDDAEISSWRYVLEVGQEPSGRRRPIVKREEVYKDGDAVASVARPNANDSTDPERLTQTYLEQVNSNQAFRPIADFFSRVVYLHLVPQLLKHAEGIQGNFLESDPFGQGFLERIGRGSLKRTPWFSIF